MIKRKKKKNSFFVFDDKLSFQTISKGIRQVGRREQKRELIKTIIKKEELSDLC